MEGKKKESWVAILLLIRGTTRDRDLTERKFSSERKGTKT